MFTANVWNKHHTDTNEYKATQLLPAGILIDLDDLEVLIPWHRVHEVYSPVAGAIGLEFGQ